MCRNRSGSRLSRLDVDALHPCAAQDAGEALEPRPVGSHRQLVEAVANALAKLCNQKLDALAHERLAARQPNSLHPTRNEDVG